jgi:asparagine synthase (glutamine-hydrolysing)
MCGIFGAVNFTGVFVHESYHLYVELTDLVKYRGPDDFGYVSLNLKEGTETSNLEKFDVFLGNRRLSILDLSSAGHQPMTDGKGRWITFNGEIFNFLELRRELELRGHRFHSESDTEVILHIYDEYGEKGFDKLNGMWAFAIVDVARCAVVLSRDRFSIKPLYLLETGRGQIFFASEIKQLLPLLDSRKLNTETMTAFLAQGLLDHSSDTFFDGITKLPPKTNLIISVRDGTLSRHEYWSLECDRAACSTDPVEEFRELLLDSTRIRLRSDVPVGLLLSGGLDSSAIAAACNKVATTTVTTYSIISSDPRVSEERYVDELVNRFQLKSYKLLLGDEDALESLHQVLYHMDEPFGGFSVVAQYKILQAVRQQCNAVVLLSGQGGDETLLGYLKFYFFYLQQLIRTRRYGKAAIEILFSLMRRTVLRQFNLRTAKRYIPAMKDRGVGFLRMESKKIPIWEAKEMRQRQILDIDHYSVPALTHYEDRNAAAHSLEIRHPFLDYRLVSFLVNLPTEQKLRNGWTKLILRKSFPELPSSIRWRREKNYFSVPEGEWLRTGLRNYVPIMFRNSVLAEMNIINKEAFLGLYSAFQNHRKLVNPLEISRTLIAELWAQKFLLHSPASPLR